MPTTLLDPAVVVAPPLAGVTDALLAQIAAHLAAAPRHRRLWDYYRNPQQPSAPASDDDAMTRRPYTQAQELGLPARLTGRVREISGLQTHLPQVARKEIVIENDIAWRIDTAVDFLFGKPIVLNAAVADPARRERIGRLLRLVLAGNGGLPLLQRLALLGSVYGHVDVIVKLAADDDADADADFPDAHFADAADTQPLGEPPPHADVVADDDAPSPSASPSASPARRDGSDDSLDDASLAEMARRVRFEIVEPSRGLPLLDPRDASRLLGYVHAWPLAGDDAAAEIRDDRGWLGRLVRSIATRLPARLDTPFGFELHTPGRWELWERGRRLAFGAGPLKQIPLVHIQHTPLPNQWAGGSDVEALIPLQDELNTRLSDRASRIAMQSFRMYLARGLDDVSTLPIGPGQLWATSNENASILEIGGDASCPSEDAHIAEIREALDKTSGVSPIAAGAIKGRIGRLTSAAALRVTLLALLARTERRRTVYGGAVARLCELSLAFLDAAGLFATTPDERRVEIHWPNPVPLNDLERLDLAKARIDLGVPREQVLRALGLDVA
jgi:hypothetical protein